MRIVTIGDQHIKRDSIPLSRVMVNRIVEEIDKLRPDLVVFMGDALDRFADIRLECLDLAVEMFGRCADICEIVVLIGNHDMSHHTDFLLGKHPFTALRRWSNTTVADKVIHKIINGYQLTFCPYVPTGRFYEALNTNPGWENSKVIFSHQTFAGADFERGSTADVWDTSHPMNLVGHWHTFRQLQPNLIYVCTPMEHDFGEKMDPLRGITLFEIDESITYTRIPLHLPTHMEVEIPTRSIISYIPPSNTILKLRFKGSTSDNKQAKKLHCIKEWRAAGIKVVFDDVNEVEVVPEAPKHIQTVRYRDALWEACIGDPVMEKIYSEFYPS